MGLNLPVRQLVWRQSWRVIPTRYPEDNLYQRIAEDKDLPAIEQVENIGNDRIRLQTGQIHLLRSHDALPKGRGAVTVIAEMAYLREGRFCDGTFPVYYAGDSLKTAISETVYHAEKRLMATREKPILLMQRVLISRIDGRFHDLRRRQKHWRNVYDPKNYTASQNLGHDLWHQGSGGIVYNSVRRRAGQCMAVYSPQYISHCRQERCLQYDWDGQKIARIYEIHEFHEFPRG